MIDEAGWFGPPERALFGWWCRPENRSARLGVLICQTIGEEQHNAHHTMRLLAHRLAYAGIASLRFDYHGVGDSLGDWAGPGRVSAWVRSVEDAATAMRAAGVDRLAVVGMRVGAALAVRALASTSVDAEALVLWDPCSGKDMLREGQARKPSKREPPEGTVDTPGYFYDQETTADLRALDLSEARTAQLAPRVLVLPRAERPRPRGLNKALDCPGVEWAEAVGQSELMDVPMTDSIVPEETLARVIDYLVSAATGEVKALSDLGSPTVEAPTTSGGYTTETVVRLGELGLFGILSDPEARRPGPTVIFVNVANDRHTGPGRRWVQLSRMLADDGFQVLRFDQSGTGDSPSHPGQPFGLMYAGEWLDDMAQVVVGPLLNGEPPAIVGLCSGAYSAMEVASTERVDSVYAINVILHALATSPFSPTAHPGRRAARPPSFLFAVAQHRWGKPGAAAWRVYRQLTPWNAPTAAVSTIVRRGTRVVIVAGRNDARHFRESAFWQIFGMRRWIRRDRFAILEDPVVDHPLMTQEGQDWAVQRIHSDLLAHYRQ